MSKLRIFLFDTETNGFRGSSVLSFSGTVLEIYRAEDGKIKLKTNEKIDDYFLPKEKWNPGAARVHGMTKKYIQEKIFEKHCDRGWDNFDNPMQQTVYKQLLNSCDLIVAHNLAFDESFFKFKIKEEKKYCTMLAMKDALAIPHAKHGIKNPKLMELANYYEVEYSEDKLHGSWYDVLVLRQVFIEMIKDKNSGLWKELDLMLKIKEESDEG